MSYGHVASNAADWRLLRRRFPTRHKTKHHAAPDYVHVPNFVRQLHIEQQRDVALSPYAIEFLLLTAARSNEVSGMQWAEVDFDAGIWTVPVTRTKSGRELRVPLSTRALEILVEQRRRTNSEYVWPGVRRSKPINSKSVYLYLVRTMQLKFKFTLHGLRSSFRDWAGNETNFDRVTCELALAHQAGDATELAYRRQDALEKRRKLMMAWASFCCGEQR
jgi:integrase